MKIEDLDLEKANKILLGVFLVLLGLFMLDILLGLGKSKVTVLRPEGEVELGKNEDIKQSPDFSSYAKEIKKRQLFKGTLPQERAASAEASQQDVRKILPSDFQLMGIAAGVNPQAIIMNKKTQQTYFLYKGQSQDNLTIEEILENKVKLSYEGEIFELFL